MEHRVIRGSSYLKRISHSSRSFVSSMFNNSNDKEPSSSTVRRFEWFADGASEFLRYMELGGTPRLIFFSPLVRRLLEGKGVMYCFVRGDQDLSFFLQPCNSPGFGLHCRLIFLLEDSHAPENNFCLGVHLRLNESSDIVGVAVRCMQLFRPHLGSTAETVKRELTQLPAQDFCWATYDFSSHKKHWDNLHTIFCTWFQQDPECCPQHDHQTTQSCAGSSTRSSTESSLPCDIYLEPVTEVYLQGYVALSSAGHKRRRENFTAKTQPAGGYPYVKIEGLFSPHAPCENLAPGVEGSATEMINGEDAHCGVYPNISFEQLSEIMLPKAADHLRGNAVATSYQMVWKSKHGGAYFRLTENSWRETDQNVRGGGKRKEIWGKRVQRWTTGIAEFIGSWAAHVPAELGGPITEWVKKEKQMPALTEEVTPRGYC